MSASESAPEAEGIKAVNTDIQSVRTRLLSARARQQRLYLLLGLTLILGLLFIFGFILFSNGTAIEIHPEEARKTANLNVVGAFGAAIGHRAYSLRDTPVIEVSAKGFRTLQKTLSASETGGTVAVELSEVPGQLRMRTKPHADNTRWFIDGKVTVVADELEKELFSGNHNIEINSPYYRKKRIDIVMVPGRALNRTVDLQKITGRLLINTVPAGAIVTINGKPVGASPVSVVKTGGKYRLEVTHQDYQTISEDVEITNADKILERDYRLAPRRAFLDVRLSPAGGLLLLNGKKVSLSAGELAINGHVKNSLSYHKGGYFSQQRTISIAPGLHKRVSFHLEAETGMVDLRSKPSATILIDGKAVGQTPLAIRLSALPHRIELRKQGYRSDKRSVVPTEKYIQRIDVVLHTELQARLREAPKELKNSVGMWLRLFQPHDTFVMGAPRYEKGQRANEFLRTVKLTKPFYAGKQEVTGAQYARFKKNRGARNEPVRGVSWIEAAEYCNWLSRREKLTPFYNLRKGRLRGSNVLADGYRLLSEAEWEWLARKAARAEQSRFTWGNETTIPANSGNIADESAKGKSMHYVPNYSDGYSGIAPVGSYAVEKSGLYDLTGNVSEWVHDVYSLIPPVGQKTEIDPLGQKTGDTHTVKGSNWRSGTITELRASYREGSKAGRDNIGFRVARYIYVAKEE